MITEDYITYSASKTRWIMSLSEDDKVDHISIIGTDIMYIENPSETIQLAAIKTSRWAYRCIKKPTDEARNLHMALWVM